MKNICIFSVLFVVALWGCCKIDNHFKTFEENASQEEKDITFTQERFKDVFGFILPVNYHVADNDIYLYGPDTYERILICPEEPIDSIFLIEETKKNKNKFDSISYKGHFYGDKGSYFCEITIISPDTILLERSTR